MHLVCFSSTQEVITSHKRCQIFEKRNWIFVYDNEIMVRFGLASFRLVCLLPKNHSLAVTKLRA